MIAEYIESSMSADEFINTLQFPFITEKETTEVIKEFKKTLQAYDFMPVPEFC